MAKEIGQLNVKIGLDATGFQNGISNLNREMRKVQSEFKLASAELGKHGKELDGLRLKSDNLTKQTELQRQKVQALEAAAVKVGSDFETGMSEVKAISGATGEDFVKLQEKAKEMGATTKFSATEASEGLKYMAMAGWDTTQMLDGLDGR